MRPTERKAYGQKLDELYSKPESPEALEYYVRLSLLEAKRDSLVAKREEQTLELEASQKPLPSQTETDILGKRTVVVYHSEGVTIRLSQNPEYHYNGTNIGKYDSLLASIDGLKVGIRATEEQIRWIKGNRPRLIGEIGMYEKALGTNKCLMMNTLGRPAVEKMAIYAVLPAIVALAFAIPIALIRFILGSGQGGPSWVPSWLCT